MHATSFVAKLRHARKIQLRMIIFPEVTEGGTWFFDDETNPAKSGRTSGSRIMNAFSRGKGGIIRKIKGDGDAAGNIQQPFKELRRSRGNSGGQTPSNTVTHDNTTPTPTPALADSKSEIEMLRALNRKLLRRVNELEREYQGSRKKGEPFDWLHLGEDFWEVVFSYLVVPTHLRSAALTCQRWHTTAKPILRQLKTHNHINNKSASVSSPSIDRKRTQPAAVNPPPAAGKTVSPRTSATGASFSVGSPRLVSKTSPRVFQTPQGIVSVPAGPSAPLPFTPPQRPSSPPGIPSPVPQRPSSPPARTTPSSSSSSSLPAPPPAAVPTEPKVPDSPPTPKELPFDQQIQVIKTGATLLKSHPKGSDLIKSVHVLAQKVSFPLPSSRFTLLTLYAVFAVVYEHPTKRLAGGKRSEVPQRGPTRTGAKG